MEVNVLGLGDEDIKVRKRDEKCSAGNITSCSSLESSICILSYLQYFVA